MKIKEICEKTGLTDRTVRYYIEEGLVSPFYTENYLGRKSFDFSDADLERLKAIATLRSFSFTVEEIKELFSKGVVGTEIVETVKKRTQANLDDSQRCLSVLSGLDLSREADILTLAQTLYDSDAAIRNETVMPNPKKRILSFAKSCALFLVVWLPVLVAVGVMIVKFCTLHTPVVRPAFFVATLLCFLPSLLTALIFKKSKKTRKILPALLMSLCVLALPVGAILSSQSVMICHHSYEAYHTVREASCSREGERVLKCKDCGDLRTQAISRLPHTEQILEPRAPTCALEGLGEGKICSLCGEITLPQAVIPKTDDHTTVIDAAVSATCKDTGLTEGSHCSLCNKVLVAQTVIPKTEEHTVVTDKGVAATCKSTGITEGSHCSLCNKVLVAQTVIPKTEEHTVVTDKGVAATCKSTGLTEGSHCSVCDKVLVAQTVIPKTEDHTVVIDKAVSATCIDTGLTEGSHCSLCNKVLVAQTVIPKTDEHTPVTDKAVPATCKDTGLTEGSHCSVCNKVFVAQTVVPKTEDHTTVTDVAVPATCKNTGLTEGSHCSVCNKIFVKQVEIPKEPHNYIDGYCDSCKGKKVSEGLKFENYDGYAAVVGIGSCMDTVIIIPDVAPSGLPVKEIGMQAFQNCTNIKEVIIPDTVGTILMEAFMNCTSLEKITLPAEYWDMQSRTFKNCTALKEVVIPNHVFRVGVECFANCTSLKNVTIPSSVTTYSKDAFKGCAITNLYISSLETWLDSNFNNANSNPLYCTENLYLNNSLVTAIEINKNISFGAFMGYEKLTKVVLGNSVKTIGDSAFYGCRELTEVVFGNKLETIGTSAFYNCAKLTAVNLPSSLKTVSNKAFYGCSSLQTLTIATGLQSVGDYAFSGCIALRAIDFPITVTYMGISCLEKCASLESITIPFVGVSTCSAQYEAFGSLFGSTQYDGGEMITQITGSIGTQAYEYSYCIPTGLKHVKLLKHDAYSSTQAFHNCKYIESITFDKGVTRVGSGSFTGCTALTDIYYEGTKEEWKNLRYSETFDTVETITITCSDGIIDKN